MFPRSFEYVAPASLDEALAALADQPGAKVLAGGMSLIPLMKLRLFSPETVVDIGRIPGLDQIEDRGDHIAIGALVRHHQVAESALLAEHARALCQAASWTGDVQVRNRGTMCGSMAHADVAADQPAAALALGATMVARSAGGTREIAAADFFVDALTSALQPDEILVEVKLPKGGGASAYDKLGRRGRALRLRRRRSRGEGSPFQREHLRCHGGADRSRHQAVARCRGDGGAGRLRRLGGGGGGGGGARHRGRNRARGSLRLGGVQEPPGQSVCEAGDSGSAGGGELRHPPPREEEASRQGASSPRHDRNSVAPPLGCPLPAAPQRVPSPLRGDREESR